MSASRVLSQLARRQSVALKSTKTTSTAGARLPLATSTRLHGTFRHSVGAVSLSRHGLSLSASNRISQSLSSRWIATATPLSSSGVGEKGASSGAKGMKVAIIGQSLFGKEVHVCGLFFLHEAGYPG